MRFTKQSVARKKAMSYMNTISDIKESVVPNTPADALVFFGATGDLAHKKIFPALQSLAKRGNLDIPVIGVAKAGWTLDQLKSRAQDSVERYGGLDPDAFSRLSRRMDYIDGDYADPATFQELRRKLGNAKQPTHYLAIPPSLFETVIRGSASRVAPRARAS
jgi:glucose-6-phosphate 1-dehydrogenase